MKVVLCDDHQLLVQAMATALAGLGFSIDAAVNTPGDAVTAVALHAPDVLLIDLTFPVGSGLDAARQVVAHHPHTRVLMLTGAESPATLQTALDIGVAGYIQKGHRIEAVADAVRRVAAGEVVVDPELLAARPRADATDARRRTPLSGLTPREHHVLRLLVQGCSTKDMVAQLGVSPSTVRTHVQSIFVKLGVHTRLQAVAMLSRDGLLDTVDGLHGVRD